MEHFKLAQLSKQFCKNKYKCLTNGTANQKICFTDKRIKFTYFRLNSRAVKVRGIITYVSPVGILCKGVKYGRKWLNAEPTFLFRNMRIIEHPYICQEVEKRFGGHALTETPHKKIKRSVTSWLTNYWR